MLYFVLSNNTPIATTLQAALPNTSNPECLLVSELLDRGIYCLEIPTGKQLESIAYDPQTNTLTPTWIDIPAPAPSPNWEGFILALRASSSIKNWFGAVDALDQHYLTIQISERNTQAIQTFMGAIDYSPIKTELETLTSQYHIPLTL